MSNGTPISACSTWQFVPDVVGQADRRHPALTEFTLDAVAALEGCVEAGDGVSRHAENRRLTPSIRELPKTVPKTASFPTDAHRRN
jgi:hypothetical protein